MNLRIAISLLFLTFYSITICQNSENKKKEKQFFNQHLPSESAIIFAKDIVTYEFMNHSSVSISNKMDEMYWSKFYDNEGRQEIIFSIKRKGVWTKPTTVDFSGKYSDDVPYLSPNGKKLFFISRRPINSGAKSGKENLWYVEKLNSENWSEPKPVSSKINSGHLHWQFSIAKNQTIYFGSDDGIKRSEYIDGEYQSPLLITEVLHPNYKGWNPHIAPDESYIIFSSKELAGSYGKNDLYIGFKNANNQWSEPINLGNKINGPKNELCPIISPNGELLFFVKQDNVYNVYWVNTEFIQELNPKN